MKPQRVTDSQIRSTISTGEFPDEITGSAANVAVIMTQSWCPQWERMSSWIETIGEETGIRMYTVIYDREPYFHEFMSFKENIFGNDLVPYVRYYVEGSLVKETNYTSKDFFLKTFSQS
jgi:hypothetical protein